MPEEVLGGLVAPDSYSGVATKTVTLTGGGTHFITADLLTNPTAYLHYKTGSAACTIANSQGFLAHGDQLEIPVRGTLALQTALFNSAGAAVTGGANDYVRKAVVRR